MNLGRVAIIGGTGKMGQWFCDFFLKEGFEVIASARRKEKLLRLARQIPIKVAADNVDAVKRADTIVLSVPPQNFEAVVKEIAPHMRASQKILDITSIKEMPVKVMHKHIRRGLILGTHPVFGPDVDPRGQNFVLTPTNSKEKRFAAELDRWLSTRGFVVSILSPKRHDQLMSIVLGLAHFIGLAACEAILKSGDIKTLEKTGGSSYRLLINLAKRVVASDPELYSVLQISLPAAERERFVKIAGDWLRLIKKRDTAAFVKRMAYLAKRLEDESR